MFSNPELWMCKTLAENNHVDPYLGACMHEFFFKLLACHINAVLPVILQTLWLILHSTTTNPSCKKIKKRKGKPLQEKKLTIFNKI